MTVCLTGDVHHMSLETRDQAYMEQTEVEAALECAEIAGEYDIPVTLFVTGKAAKEEPERVQALAAMDHVEIGGHNYWAFDTLVHKAWRGITGSWNGPRWFQSWEIRKTAKMFKKSGIEIQAWRDHAYRYDDNTVKLLSDTGITHFSDVVDPDGRAQEIHDLISVPVNTPPDHEHIYHAFRTPEFVSANGFNGPFGTESHTIDGWLQWVSTSIDTTVDRSEPATVLAHPGCMDIADGFSVFEKLCDYLSNVHEAVHMTDICLND